MTYFFADLHGDITPLIKKIKELEASKCNTMNYFIVLGDHGLDYYLDEKDENLKQELEKKIGDLKITIILLRGNHDVHPRNIYLYEKVEMFGGNVFVERKFSHLVFLDEADVYCIENKDYVVYSGGHSKDWFSRILKAEYWDPSEQINDVDHKRILELYKKKIDKSKKYCLLGHQLPRKLSPYHWDGENEMEVRTEKNLQEVVDIYGSYIDEIRAGHYHVNKHWKNNEKDIYVHYSNEKLI